MTETTTTLRRWRLDHGLSLGESSGLTGYSVSELSRIETGKRRPRMETKLRIARRLGVNVGELFPIDEEEALFGAAMPSAGAA